MIEAIFTWFKDAWAFTKCYIGHYNRWEWAPDSSGNSAYCPDCGIEWYIPE